MIGLAIASAGGDDDETVESSGPVLTALGCDAGDALCTSKAIAHDVCGVPDYASIGGRGDGSGAEYYAAPDGRLVMVEALLPDLDPSTTTGDRIRFLCVDPSQTSRPIRQFTYDEWNQLMTPGLGLPAAYFRQGPSF